MSTKVVLIGGSRWYTNQDTILYHLDMLLDEGDVILTGGEAGAGRVAERKLENRVIKIKPEFLVGKHRAFDQRDFFSRNQQLVSNCTEAILFWDGVTTEIKDLIRLLEKQNKPYVIIDIGVNNYVGD